MKKIFLMINLLLCYVGYSQVIIKDEVSEIRSTDFSNNALLEFGEDNKGIVLPIVDIASTDSIYALGTFLMDRADKRIKVKVKVRESEDPEVEPVEKWVPLSDEGSFEAITDKALGEEISTAVIFNDSPEVGGGVVIGSPNSDGEIPTNADGALVLEGNGKALILPRVADPHLNIPSPVAGTMCYDTVSNSLAIFDGVVWSYWK